MLPLLLDGGYYDAGRKKRQGFYLACASRVRYSFPMIKYYIHAWYQAWYSGNFYRSVYTHWQGAGMLYLLLFLAVGLVPVSIHRANEVVESFFTRVGDEFVVADELLQMVEQLPEMILQDGKLALSDTTISQPYIIRALTDMPVLVIDTTGKSVTLDKSFSGMLLTRDAVFMALARGEMLHLPYVTLTEPFNIPASEAIVINKETVLDALHVLIEKRSMFAKIYYMSLLFPLFFTYSIKAVSFALATIGILQFFRINLPFQQAIRLAVVSATPVLWCEMVGYFMHVQIFAYPDTVYLLMHGMYLYIAVDANREQLLAK